MVKALYHRLRAIFGKSDSVRLLHLIKQSRLFDAAWYLQHNPDVAAAGADPAVHYLNHGAAEGRLPSAQFDNDFYLSQLSAPLIYASPFLHYLAEGKDAGLQAFRTWSSEPWWWQLPEIAQPEIDHAALLHRLALHKSVVVIIPVFNAVEAFRRCLASLTLYRQSIDQIIVVDDASTDAAVSELLQAYQSDPLFSCVWNERNLGFSGSINRGIALAREFDRQADIVLLNSDTEVTAGWLRHLRYAAYSADNIATATPVSNNAGAFSVPQVGESVIPAAFDLAEFARACAQGALAVFPQVPTGHGFCLYVRQAALSTLGNFDAKAFPRGYGEENDFCMRALRAGWLHCIAPRAYIYHQRSASFGADKAELLAQGRQVIDTRYPDYTDLVSAAFSSADVKAMRERIGLISRMPAAQAKQIKPRVLFVIATRTGGTPQTNQDLMQALADKLECFVLHCDSGILTLQHFADGVYTDVNCYQLQQPIQAVTHNSAEYDEVVAGWLIQWAIELVHIRHLAWHSLGLVQVVKTLGLPLVKSFHDFYTLCPSVKLLDERQQYCAATCTSSQGQCRHELWPEDAFTQLKHHQIHQWQQLFSTCLSQCDAFITTNAQARSLVQEKYSGLKHKPFFVIGHGRDFSEFADLAVKPKLNEPIRVLCPGNITVAKGLGLINELALRYPKQLEIHILGIISSELTLPANVVIHGRYSRDQFMTLVKEIKPHCGAVLSIWPETWCHTLTELWAAGIPVIGLPFGAVAERIKLHDAGWVLAASTADQIAKLLLQENFAQEWQQKQRAILNWQQECGTLQTCHFMAEQYLSVYKSVLPAIT